MTTPVPNFLEIAERAFQLARQIAKDHNDDNLGSAIIANALLQVHKAGYQGAKEFYIDKAPGWGTDKQQSNAGDYDKNQFGNCVDLPIADGYNIIILCELTNHGMTPLCVKLPHQVYIEGLDRGKKYVAIPACSSDYVNITEENLDTKFGKANYDE